MFELGASDNERLWLLADLWNSLARLLRSDCPGDATHCISSLGCPRPTLVSGFLPDDPHPGLHSEYPFRPGYRARNSFSSKSGISTVSLGSTSPSQAWRSRRASVPPVLTHGDDLAPWAGRARPGAPGDLRTASWSA